MTRKALGLHVHSGDQNGQLREYIDRVRPAVMKWLDDDGGSPLVPYARERGALTVLRVYEEHQQLGAAGGRYIERIVAAMRRWPGFMVAESMNEEFQEPGVARRRAEFDIELMKALGAIGRKAGILCASTGQPELAFWRDYLPALEYAATHGHYVCLHEYGGGPPGMKWGVGRNQHSGYPDGFDRCEADTANLRGWWVLRYRRHVEEWRRLGLGVMPRIYIGEGGIDDIWPRPGPGGKGYKDYVGQHPPNIGDYAEQWAWTCRRWAEDAYLVGGVDFGWATRDPQWSSFDLSQDRATLERVMATQAALPAGGGASMTEVEAVALEVARARQVLQLNPRAGLQRAIAAAGFWPTSGEFTFRVGGREYVGQRAEQPATGEVRAYYCPKPEYAPVRWVMRPKA